jgi:hypothetical protein
LQFGGKVGANIWWVCAHATAYNVVAWQGKGPWD